jgi:hypothetical protein
LGASPTDARASYDPPASRTKCFRQACLWSRYFALDPSSGRTGLATVGRTGKTWSPRAVQLPKTLLLQVKGPVLHRSPRVSLALRCRFCHRRTARVGIDCRVTDQHADGRADEGPQRRLDNVGHQRDPYAGVPTKP